jgi:glycosyltransferase involved in cell wall biosynthesis
MGKVKISAYTYVRNGLKMKYPFLESIQSAIGIVDEYIVVLGDSDDGSREAILNLNNPKIKIIDVVWDMSLREGGKLFAIQSNIGLDHVSGDWILHLQADEVLHENDLQKLLEYIRLSDSNHKTEGLLFPFLNFRGDYNHIHTGRQAHRFEIRAFKKNSLIRSYRDSQGFRKYSSLQAYANGEKGEKLRVTKIDAPIFHYNYVRPPKVMKEKAKVFSSMYHTDQWIEEAFSKIEEIDYNRVDKLEVFKGTHPKVMLQTIREQDWIFISDPTKRSSSLRHKILNKIEDWIGYRIGEYKNYIVVK